MPLTTALRFVLAALLLAAAPLAAAHAAPVPTAAEQRFQQHARGLYEVCGLAGKLDYQTFVYALTGYYNLQAEKRLRADAPLTVVDFRLPSTWKRLYVIDLKNQRLLYHTYTSHGQGSGNDKASHFSNTSESHQSSLGFYVTAETYEGKHGYSLRLDGMDRGFNCNARSRAVVMHGADYVSEAFIKRAGRLGRSYGCPALAWEVYRPLIDVVKNGGCLFIYAPDAAYTKASHYLNVANAASYLAATRVTVETAIPAAR